MKQLGENLQGIPAAQLAKIAGIRPSDGTKPMGFRTLNATGGVSVGETATFKTLQTGATPALGGQTLDGRRFVPLSHNGTDAVGNGVSQPNPEPAESGIPVFPNAEAKSSGDRVAIPKPVDVSTAKATGAATAEQHATVVRNPEPGEWRRGFLGKTVTRSTLIVSAAALATACTTSGPPPSHEAFQGKPTGTYSGEQIPGNPGWHSLTETYQALSTDPKLSKEQSSLDLHPIAQQYKESDYQSVTSTPPGGSSNQENVIDTGSAPVMTIRYDKAAKSFIYQTQTPKGIDNQTLYQLMQPVMRNQTILSAAFQNDDVTRIVVRLEEPTSGQGADGTSDAYVQQDWSTPKEGMQRTVFWFLPGAKNIDLQEETDVVRHETIHGLTGNNSLSDSEGAPATPNPTDLAKWDAACIDLRDLALQDAERYKQSSIDLLQTLITQANNADVTEVANEVITALQNGTFDRLQPQQGENINQAFSGKVPDCITVGPWGVFVRLMDDRGGANIVDKIFNNGATANTSDTLHDNYQQMEEFQTIYRVLREGTYEQDSPEKLLGHEGDDWDELVTSTSDVSIAYPTKVAKMIKSLPPERRDVVLEIVNLALTTLDNQIPENRNPDFHALITNRLNAINRIVGNS